MSVTDTWSTWSATAASNSPAGGATPEIDDEFRNIKAQVKGNAVAMSGDQTVAGVKTFSSFPVGPSTSPTTNYQMANKVYVDNSITTATSSLENYADSAVSSATTSLQDYADSAATDAASSAVAEVEGGLLLASYMRYSDHKGNSTAGGASTSGDWYKRDLNTEDSDAGSLGSVGSNMVTLGAGTYYARATAPFFLNSGKVRIRIYNETGAAALLTGPNTGTTVTCDIQAVVSGYFTLSGTSNISVQYQSSGSQSTNGLGEACSFSEDEIYTVMELWKVA